MRCNFKQNNRSVHWELVLFVFHNFNNSIFVSLQQKYFDSGDYNMAKAKIKNKQLPTAAPEKTEITGDHIPTPQDLPQRKPSLVASKLAG